MRHINPLVNGYAALYQVVIFIHTNSGEYLTANTEFLIILIDNDWVIRAGFDTNAFDSADPIMMYTHFFSLQGNVIVD